MHIHSLSEANDDTPRTRAHHNSHTLTFPLSSLPHPPRVQLQRRPMDQPQHSPLGQSQYRPMGQYQRKPMGQSHHGSLDGQIKAKLLK